MQENYQFNIFCGTSGLLNIRKTWETLYSASTFKSYYNDWRWHYALINNEVVKGASYILIEVDSEAIAIIPLQTRRNVKNGITLPFRVVGFPHHRHIALSDIVILPGYANTQTLNALLDHLNNMPLLSWQQLEFIFPGRSNAALLFQGTTPRHIKCNKNAYFDCHSEATLTNKISSKTLRNVKRLHNKAKAQFPDLSFTIITDTDKLGDAFQKFLETEASGWKGENESAILQNQNLTRFYRELTVLFSETGNSRVNLLKTGDSVIAMQFCIVSGETCYILKIAYDETYKDLGMGNILLKEFLFHCAADNKISEANLVTAPGWSDRWHPEIDYVQMAFGYRNNFLGRLVSVAFKMTGMEDFLINHYQKSV